MNRQAKFLVLCLFVGLFSANLCDEGESWIKLNRIEIKLKTRNTHFSIMHPHTLASAGVRVRKHFRGCVCVWGGVSKWQFLYWISILRPFSLPAIGGNVLVKRIIWNFLKICQSQFHPFFLTIILAIFSYQQSFNPISVTHILCHHHLWFLTNKIQFEAFFVSCSILICWPKHFLYSHTRYIYPNLTIFVK